MPKIFISYRREDSEHVTGRIHDRLEPHFGRDNVFLDVDTIPLGVDFREHLDRAVGQCDVLLAVIGEQWLDVRHQEGPMEGQRRLDAPGDFVRIEIESALARGIPVIPVLVGRAKMPGEQELPEGLRPLAYRNAAEVRSGRDFRDHVDRLVRGIEHVVRAREEVKLREQEKRLDQAREEQRRQRLGEQALRQLVRDALERTGGKTTTEDNSAATQLVRQHALDRERAKVIIREVRERWEKERSRERQTGDGVTNSLGMKFARVPPGEGWLGGGGGKPGANRFRLEQGLWCGVYPVTQAEWQAVMGNNPSHFKGNPRCPVESVSWNDVEKFIQQLNQKNREDGLSYRLPTAEEWEYICRGGAISHSQSAYHFYFARSKTDLMPNPSNDLSSTQANFDGNQPAGSAPKGPYLERTCDVGLYLPNPLGIYDLHGNVWEWTSSAEGSDRVIRGGCWSAQAVLCAASNRSGLEPGDSFSLLGFRLLAVPI